MTFFTAIFLIAIISYFAITYWLSQRQIRSIDHSFDVVPPQFSEKISLQQHQKAARYSKAKLRFSLKDNLFGIALLLLWTLGGGLALLGELWQNASLSTLWTGVGFLLSFIFIGTILELPISWYRTFVLEARFGFNKSTLKLFVGDLFKTSLLTLVLGVPFAWLILYLMSISGQFWWLFVWLVLIIISVLSLWIYPNYIAPLFNKFTPLDDEELTERIMTLLDKTGFGSNGIFIMDGSKRSGHGNAYFTGLGKQKRVVFFDTLLETLSHNEILAVLSHELGHFSHKHIRKKMVNSFAIIFVLLAIFGYLIDKDWFYQGLGASQASHYMALALFLLIEPVFTFFIHPLNNALSRKHEYQADAFAAEYSNASDLVSALVILYRDNASTLTPDSYYSLFYDSHPSASLRINHLEV